MFSQLSKSATRAWKYMFGTTLQVIGTCVHVCHTLIRLKKRHVCAKIDLFHIKMLQNHPISLCVHLTLCKGADGLMVGPEIRRTSVSLSLSLAELLANHRKKAHLIRADRESWRGLAWLPAL